MISQPDNPEENKDNVMTFDHIELQVRDFLINNFIFDSTVQLSTESSLMENGIVDSTGILEVLMWVESNFGVHVEDSEVLPENFDSVGNMTRYVLSKQIAKAAA